MEIILLILGSLVILPLMLLYLAFSWGYVCNVLYYWFIIPVFPNLPLLTITQCIGIVLFLSIFKSHSNTSYNKEFKEKYVDEAATYSNIILQPWVILFSSYIIKLFLF